MENERLIKEKYTNENKSTKHLKYCFKIMSKKEIIERNEISTAK